MVNPKKKTSTISDSTLGNIDMPFHFKKANSILTAGHHEEYFVYVYILDSKTGQMKSYACYEGNLLTPGRINPATLNLFITIPDGRSSDTKDAKINILVFNRK